MFLRPLIYNSKRVALFTNARLLKETNEQKNNYSSYGASKPEGDPKLYTQCEIIKNPEEWKYVERYLPKLTINEPSVKSSYPSGWKPVNATPEKVSYFIERTKNHLMPVYLDISRRGQCKVTKVRKISGDIWLLKKILLEYLEKLNKKPIGVRVDELGGMIKFRGDHVVDIQNWLSKRGF